MEKQSCFLMLVFSLIFNLEMVAQRDSLALRESNRLRKNAINLEILGNGAVYSFNYDRLIPLKNDAVLVIRIGGNEYHGAFTTKRSYNFLGSIGILSGIEKHFFEPGLGYTYFSGSADRLTILAIGYRYQGRRGLLIRATPMYIHNSEAGDTFGNSLWLGISIGYSF